MAMTSHISDLYEFGACRLDVQRRVLTRDGHPVSLTPKTFELLLLLVQSQGRALSKQQLMSALWSDTFVDEANLSFQISALRKALGDGASQWVETIPKHGYRFAGDVIAIPAGGDDAAKSEALASASSHATDKVAHRPYVWPWIITMAVLIVIIAASWVVLLTRSTEEVRAKVPVTIPLTTDPGYETTPSFSPDGSQVAFAWSKESKPDYDIYVKLVGPGEPLQLTTDPARDLNPAWSPKGGLIAFERFTMFGKADLYVIPALGGAAEQRIASGVAVNAGYGSGPNSSIAWTPDGKWLAHWADDQRSGIWLFGVDNPDKRRLTDDGAGAAFSEDGRRMAYIRGVNTGVALYVLPLTAELTAAAPPTRVTPEVSFIRTVAWTPQGDGLVFSGSGHLGVPRLYKVTLAANHVDAVGEPELLPFGENGDAFSISSRTGSLVYSAYLRDTALLRLDLQEPDRPPVPVAVSTYDELTPDYSPDGLRIAFTSTRTGAEEIWVADADGSKARQVTTMNGPICSAPQWSPNGLKILFQSTGTATSRALYVVDPQTRVSERLTNGPNEDNQASWSRDGKMIYFLSTPPSRPDRQIWKMPSAGGRREQVTRQGGLFGIESIDQQYLYYAKAVGSDRAISIWRVLVNGGEEIPVVDGLNNPQSFAVARDGLYFTAGSVTWEGPRARDESIRKNTIDFFEFKTGRRRTILELDKSAWNGLALSPDERYLLYSVANSISRNLMLVDKIE